MSSDPKAEVDPLSVTIDCRSLAAVENGTQVHALGLTLALAARDDVRVRALTPPDIDPRAADLFAAAGVEMLSYDEAIRAPSRTSIVHRPEQMNTIHDQNLLLTLGEKLFVTQQDLIAYRHGSYHENEEFWQRYRDSARDSLRAADRTLFFSATTLDEATAEGLVDPEFASVVGIGVEAPTGLRDARQGSVRPDEVDPETPFLLFLGTDLEHKNRPFALKLMTALIDRHGWPGSLVIAGPRAALGSTETTEREILASSPELAERVVTLGSVSNDEKQWLLAKAAAVVFPSTEEGFGLIPFEAALAGTPCAFAAVSSLAEVLPPDEAMIVPWDAGQSAAALMPVLTDTQVTARQTAALVEASRAHSWEATAAATVSAYRESLATPRPAAQSTPADQGGPQGVKRLVPLPVRRVIGSVRRSLRRS